MNQQSLFAEQREYDPLTRRDRIKLIPRIETPASHRNDPETSRAAEKKMRKSPKTMRRQAAIIEAVREFPGITAKGLATKLEGHPDFPNTWTARYIEIQRRKSECVGIVERDQMDGCMMLWPEEDV